MKKVLLILLGIFFFCSCNVYALTKVSIKESKRTSDNVTFDVTLEDNPGFQTLGLKIRYDTKKLEYIDSSLLAFKDADLKDIVINDKNIISLYAISTEKLLKYNGDIAQINFKLKDNSLDNAIEFKITDFNDGKTDLDYEKSNENATLEEVDLNSSKTLTLDNENNKWISSNEDLAGIDSNGKIIFKKDGKVTFSQIDENGNIIEEKNYSIKKAKKNNFILIAIIIFLLIIIITFVLLHFFKKLKNKKINL